MSTKLHSEEVKTSAGPHSRRRWKNWLLKAGELRGQAGEIAFERITLLNNVFEDREWREDSGQVDDFALAALLDAYVEDLCLPFLNLRAMREHFPDRKQWKEGKLASMHKQMIRERSEAEDTKKTRKRAKVKDLEEANRQISQLSQENEGLKTEVRSLQLRVNELENENTLLRQQIGSGRRAA